MVANPDFKRLARVAAVALLSFAAAAVPAAADDGGLALNVGSVKLTVPLEGLGLLDEQGADVRSPIGILPDVGIHYESGDGDAAAGVASVAGATGAAPASPAAPRTDDAAGTGSGAVLGPQGTGMALVAGMLFLGLLAAILAVAAARAVRARRAGAATEAAGREDAGDDAAARAGGHAHAAGPPVEEVQAVPAPTRPDRRALRAA